MKTHTPDLLSVCEDLKNNFDRWLETGIPASPKESKVLYERLCAAIEKAKKSPIKKRGFYLLEKGDTIKEGDEFLSEDGKWGIVESIGEAYDPDCHFQMRRKGGK